MKALAFSGGKDSMACLHLMRDSLDCAIYVDTGFSYPETQALVDYAAALLPMHVVAATRNDAEGIAADVVPVEWTVVGQAVTHKKACTIRSYFDCCFESIGLPIITKARELGVTELVYGQRNAESRRATSRDGDVVAGMVRRHPIENWTDEEVIRYLATKMEVPAHYAIKHSSLDCYDCTAYRKDSTDRVEWMREVHPVLFTRYEVRRNALDQAMREAL